MVTRLGHLLVILTYGVKIAYSQTACDFDFEYGPNDGYDVDIANMSYVLDDCLGPYQTSGISIPFKGQVFTQYFVCTFGLLCFGSSYPSSSLRIPQVGTSNGNESMYCLAPYYTDLVLRQGNIWHRNVNSTADISIMNLAKDVVFNKTGDEITPQFMIKVTWEEMHHFNSYISALSQVAGQSATFQAVYITDGSKSYVVYYYLYGGMTITAEDLEYVVIGSIVGGNVTGLNNTVEFLQSPDENLILGDCKGQYLLLDITTMNTNTPKTGTTTPTINYTAPTTTSTTEAPTTSLPTTVAPQTTTPSINYTAPTTTSTTEAPMTSLPTTVAPQTTTPTINYTAPTTTSSTEAPTTPLPTTVAPQTTTTPTLSTLTTKQTSTARTTVAPQTTTTPTLSTLTTKQTSTAPTTMERRSFHMLRLLMLICQMVMISCQ